MGRVNYVTGYGVSRCSRALSTIGAALVMLAVCGFARGAEPEAKLSAEREEALVKSVRDGQLDAGTRRDAAALVFDLGSPAAVESLVRELSMTTDAGLRRVLIVGLRACRKPPASASHVLLTLAKDLDTGLLEDAAEVIGRAMDTALFMRVAAVLEDHNVAPQKHLLAVASLGYHRTQDAAQTLISLLNPTHPANLRATAIASLARLTGIDDFNGDPDRWQTWWRKAKAMSADEWRDHLVGNLARRGEALARQQAMLTERLVTAMRQRYRALPKEEREAALIAMLSDPVDAVRELSLDLVREVVTMETVGPKVAEALLTRLNDSTGSIRAGAALILRDLKNAPAADVIARRLADGTERDRAALRAYLLMMRSQPRIGAVAPAIGLLGDPMVRAEAAGVVLAAFDHAPSLVGKDQSDRVADIVRPEVEKQASPEPRFVELLGKVGDETDWKRIEALLDHKTDAVKEAAAKAWVADAKRTLGALARRAADPVIQAIVIPAATQRGESAETLMALVEHKPKNEQIAALWGKALIAIAGRTTDYEAVVKADARLREQEESTDLRLQLLSPPIDKLLARAAADAAALNATERRVYTLQLIDMLLARAEVRLASGDGKAAQADLDRVTELKIDLSAAQQSRHDLTAIHVRISAGELDDAFTRAGKILNGEPATDAAVAMREKTINLLLSCADRCVTSKQNERAMQILSRLRARLTRPVPLDLETRIAVIEARVKAAGER